MVVMVETVLFITASFVCALGGLADGKDERSELHSVVNARRHAAERTRDNHEGIPLGF